MSVTVNPLQVKVCTCGFRLTSNAICKTLSLLAVKVCTCRLCLASNAICQTKRFFYVKVCTCGFRLITQTLKEILSHVRICIFSFRMTSDVFSQKIIILQVKVCTGRLCLASYAICQTMKLS
jgi:hypothetical protein